MSEKIIKSDEEWRGQLSEEEFRICRQKGTERAFTGAYNDEKRAGTYHCTCCGAPLFNSTEKYDSGSGWPSFWQPLDPDAIGAEKDHSHGMIRVEIHCAKCDSHLGHVFEDGPRPTGLRYCINSASLKLEPDE